MQIILGLLILVYIGGLSFSLLPFKFFKNEQDQKIDEQKTLPSIARPSLLVSFEDVPNREEEDFSKSSKSISSLNFRGEWNSSSDFHIMNFFTQKAGLALLSGSFKGSKDIDDYIQILLYDGEYVDNRGIKIEFAYNKVSDFDESKSTIKNKRIEFHVTLLQNLVEKSEKICLGSYQLSFINSITQLPAIKSNDVLEDTTAKIWLNSPGCSISFFAQTSTTDAEYESTVMDYSIMMTLLCVCHLYACIHMIRSINNNEASGEGYSLVTLAFLTAWDIFLCFFHLYDAIHLDSSLFHYFITPAFWYFVLAAIFETRLLTIIWKTKYYRTYDSMNDVRRGYSRFSLRIYAFLCLILVTAYFSLSEMWFLYLTSLFFIPQIVLNAFRGQKPKFDVFYIFFLGVVRSILPLYARGCPISIFELSPDPIFIMNYSGIILMQVVTIYLQTKLGPKFFIPSIFLPAKYNYYLKMKDQLLGKEEPCSICMDNLNQSPSGIETPMLKIDNGSIIQVMRTPCKHTFHEKCLKDWMEIKLECPYCRSTLPSLH